MSLLAEVSPTDAAAEYDALAPYYDAFTAHPNYPSWVRSLEALARRHGLDGRRALDVGCGTGASLAPLVELGYEAVGCDASPGMLERAATKLPGEVPLVAADMRALPQLGEFDLVWSVNDTVNYLTEPDDLRLAFAAAAKRLAPGGVLLSDANTLATYATVFAHTQVRETATLLMAWIGSGEEDPRPGGWFAARIEVFELQASGLWRRTTSHQRQRHHPRADVAAALADAGLRLRAVHGLTAEAQIDETCDERRHAKAIYVAAHDADERR